MPPPERLQQELTTVTVSSVDTIPILPVSSRVEDGDPDTRADATREALAMHIIDLAKTGVSDVSDAVAFVLDAQQRRRTLKHAHYTTTLGCRGRVKKIRWVIAFSSAPKMH